MADDKSLLVRATRMVFYGGMRIRPGQTVRLTDQSHFSASSMVEVSPHEARDDTAAAVEASPKQRGPGGSETKTAKRATRISDDPGI